MLRRLALRRRIIVAVTLALCALAPARADDEWARKRIALEATPIQSFATLAAERVRFGRIEFVGGLVLRADAPRFGGLSGLAIDEQSGMLTAVTDHGWWFRAKLVTERDRPTALLDAEMAPIIGPEGKPLGRTRRFDSESLAIHEGVAWIGLERVHEILRFNFGRDGLAARGQSVPLPREVKTLPSNQSLEAVCYAAQGPARGTLIAIAERARKGDNLPTRGFIVQGAQKGAFDLKRYDDFDITDCAFTPKGDLIVLERRFGWFSGLSMRLRKIDPRTIKPDAVLDGDILFEAGGGTVVDNMEGLAITKNEKGETLLTLISDDNFSRLQKTVLLRFRLIE
jgi:hypothetical protein